MNRIFIVLNLLLLSAAAAFFFWDKAGITGFAVADYEITGYIASYNATDTDTGETTKIYLIGQDIYFAREKVPIEEDRLIALGSENVTADADGIGNACSMQTYEITEYYYDANGNKIFEEGEKVLYKGRTDDNGCIAAKLPKGKYSVMLG